MRVCVDEPDMEKQGRKGKKTDAKGGKKKSQLVRTSRLMTHLAACLLPPAKAAIVFLPSDCLSLMKA
ncbi:hypothetical protein Csa_019283 [Cucumis sativus]|uniref:Uncharacterized protein n=1 Tax=Cucumis sativus TaxID=3659 RepID=A0A0A0LI37_CUCSA|nr:hypothetical protein Csa_019283 [Cucumis sativus]